ncbi:MAG: DUF1015 domain-containing protein [Ignavibacteriaceae bacterium]|nr:DUF1015 domain-containing protein [Ignavibacteriaceae bacterium]
MAVIRPFNALRPSPEVALRVASVPYDVVNTEEAAELASGNNLSFLRITRSEIEFASDKNPYDPDIYTRAKENLNRIISEAPLITESEPSFYVYSLTMDGRTQNGICATFSVDDYDNNIILKHEKTRKVKEDDRTNHIVTTGAQTGVVFLTYKGVKSVNDVVAEVKKDEPLYDITPGDGIRHQVWRVKSEFNKIIINEIAGVQNLYIADGHHRAASASRARAVRKDNNPAHNGSEEYNYFIAVLFPAEELKILDYNRVIHDLNGLSKDEFLKRIAEDFEVTPSAEKKPAAPRTYGMYLDKTWYSLKLSSKHIRDGKIEGAESVGDSLDVSVLQNFLLNPVLGIDDPRTNKRIDFVGGIRGMAELEKLVDSGKFAVAFSLYPVSLDDLMNISDAGEIMPPKSTWFEPKLRDGLLTHLI